MKEILLTQGKATLVSDEDYAELNQYKWQAQKGRHTFYAQRSVWKNNKIIIIKMHRLILGITDRNIFIDHRDRNGLNNQRDNLRTCTQAQNAANKSPHINSTSKYLGVSWSEPHKKWVVQTSKNRIKIYLGLFECEKDAALAYNNAARKHHGEFANINIIN